MQLVKNNTNVPQLYTSKLYRLQYHYNFTQVRDILTRPKD
jgi:hypothetical protein